jgi:hypothetical protein
MGDYRAVEPVVTAPFGTSRGGGAAFGHLKGGLLPRMAALRKRDTAVRQAKQHTTKQLSRRYIIRTK